MEYQNLVSEVMKALYPKASIKINSITMGPDGYRDIDVEVKENSGNKKKFLFIECKDQRKPIGIEIIDAVKSKSEDLKADETIVFSNSGFTRPAIKKALRLKIRLYSAMKNNSRLVKTKIYKKIIAKRLSVDTWNLIIDLLDNNLNKILSQWTPYDINYQGLPLINWIHKESEEILKNLEDFDRKICVLMTYTFKCPTKFLIKGVEVYLKGLSIKMSISKKWLSQDIPVKISLSLGLYDYLENKIIVPDKEIYYEGPINNNSWKEIDNIKIDEVMLNNLNGENFSINYILLNYIQPIKDAGIPNIDYLIKEKEIKLCN